MRTEAPPLLPIFRSEGQGRLLARVYLAPDRPAPLAEIARELGLDSGGLTREADRLERAGLVRSERIGRQRLLRPNTDSPYYNDLHGLLLTAFGPAAAIGPALGRISGVEAAYLFGSWAARYLGEPGPEPADVDLLVVGRPARAEVARVARDLSQRLGREVNPAIVSRRRWEEADEGFIRTVRSRPHIALDLGRPGPDAR
jgi:predicted nucleotidyltransferase